MEKLKKYVELANLKRDLDERVKKVKAEIDKLEPDVITFMQESGIQNINIDDNCVYLRKDVRATFLKTSEALEVLYQQNLGDALTTTVNAQRASAIVREALGDEITGKRPEWIDKAFSVFEGFSAAVRKA